MGEVIERLSRFLAGRPYRGALGCSTPPLPCCMRRGGDFSKCWFGWAKGAGFRRSADLYGAIQRGDEAAAQVKVVLSADW